MKKSPLLVVFTLVFAGASFAEKRTWRDQKTANALVAELVKVDGDKMVLKLENGRTYTLAVDRFHKDDQAYVKQWVEDMKAGAVETSDGKKPEASPQIRRAFRITAKEDSASETTRNEARTKKTRTTTTKYTLELAVSPDVPEMKDVRVGYTVYKRKRTMDTKRKSESKTRIVSEEGEKKFESLSAGAKELITTKPVTAIVEAVEYKDKKKTFEKRTDEEVLGVTVEVTVGGAKAYAFEHPNNIRRTVEKAKARQR